MWSPASDDQGCSRRRMRSPSSAMPKSPSSSSLPKASSINTPRTPEGSPLPAEISMMENPDPKSPSIGDAPIEESHTLHPQMQVTMPNPSLNQNDTQL